MSPGSRPRIFDSRRKGFFSSVFRALRHLTLPKSFNWIRDSIGTYLLCHNPRPVATSLISLDTSPSSNYTTNFAQSYSRNQSRHPTIYSFQLPLYQSACTIYDFLDRKKNRTFSYSFKNSIDEKNEWYFSVVFLLRFGFVYHRINRVVYSIPQFHLFIVFANTYWVSVTRLIKQRLVSK